MSFPGTGKIWMNGTLVDWADAKIHVASHVVHYGSAVFEGARCYGTPKGSACFRLDEHLIRLMNSAKIYRMECPFTQEQLEKAVIDTVQARLSSSFARSATSRGVGWTGPCHHALPSPESSNHLRVTPQAS